MLARRKDGPAQLGAELGDRASGILATSPISTHSQRAWLNPWAHRVDVDANEIVLGPTAQLSP